jgi:hypothetical protein
MMNVKDGAGAVGYVFLDVIRTRTLGTVSLSNRCRLGETTIVKEIAKEKRRVILKNKKEKGTYHQK